MVLPIHMGVILMTKSGALRAPCTPHTHGGDSSPGISRVRTS